MKKTLVFGASLKPNRYSNIAVRSLVKNGFPTAAYGLRTGVIWGLQVKTNLDEFQDFHTITLYLNPVRQEEYYDAIIDLKPNRVIFNPGTENPYFYNLLNKNGIEVEVACTLVLFLTKQF